MNKLIIIALALSLAACGHSKKKTSDHKSNIDLTAAGATFPLPYYNLALKPIKILPGYRWPTAESAAVEVYAAWKTGS